jgi:hydroxylamine reductase
VNTRYNIRKMPVLTPKDENVKLRTDSANLLQNHAYSAVKIAQGLVDAFPVGVNDLPLSLVLSWYEQKAVAILLSLLYLGIKNIRIGPSLPAFITPNILQVLVEKFNIMHIKSAEEDLKAIMA